MFRAQLCYLEVHQDIFAAGRELPLYTIRATRSSSRRPRSKQRNCWGRVEFVSSNPARGSSWKKKSACRKKVKERELVQLDAARRAAGVLNPIPDKNTEGGGGGGKKGRHLWPRIVPCPESLSGSETPYFAYIIRRELSWKGKKKR